MKPTNLVWVELVNSAAAARRIPYAAAWDAMRREHPDTCTLMCALGATRAAVEAFNAQLARNAGASGRVEARNEFINEVHNYMRKAGVDYDEAYSRLSRKNPELFSKMSAAPATFANAANVTGAFNPAALVTNNREFSLPDQTPQSVFDVAFNANGRLLNGVNFGVVMDALVQHFAQEKNISHAASLEYVKQNFPKLWEHVQDIAKDRKGVTDHRPVHSVW